MMGSLAALLAIATTSAYAWRSNSTRQAPALKPSQAMRSFTAKSASALSASLSKAVEYPVALITSKRAVNSGLKTHNRSMNKSGEIASAFAFGGTLSSQYEIQASFSSNFSFSDSVVGTPSVGEARHLRQWWGGGATRILPNDLEPGAATRDARPAAFSGAAA